jgi:hypothetical protein
MKKLSLLVMLALIATLQSCAQDAPSKKLKDAFNKKFPNAKKIKWSKENESEWEAEFKMNGEEYSANFLSDGTWKETEHEIEKSKIPAAVQQTLNKEFAGYDIEEVEISETADGKVYEFALEKDESDLEVAISPDGKVVKKEVKKEDEEDND